MRWVSWIQHTDGSWLFIQFISLCLLIGTLVHLHLILILLCVNLTVPFYYWFVVLPFGWHNFFIASLVFTIWFFFCSGWYWFFLSVFSASFRSSCRPGLVVTKSLSNCLSIKDFISPSLMKLSLAGYGILGWKFFSLRMLNIGPHSLQLVGFLPRDLLWIWCVSLCGWPNLSLWLPLVFPSFQPWWTWQLCALGLLF